MVTFFRIKIAKASQLNNIPISGKWDGTNWSIGYYNPNSSVFTLKEKNFDLNFTFGNPNAGWLPITGDWTGSGKTTVGLYDPATSIFYLKYDNSSGSADLSFLFGNVNPNLIPISGNWKGAKNHSTIGLFDKSTGIFYLKYSNTTGFADNTFIFGNPNDLPITGDWTGSGTTTIGVYRSVEGKFYLRNSNAAGPVDSIITMDSNKYPISGMWYNSNKTLVGEYSSIDSTYKLYQLNNSIISLQYPFNYNISTDNIYADLSTPLGKASHIGNGLLVLNRPDEDVKDQNLNSLNLNLYRPLLTQFINSDNLNYNRIKFNNTNMEVFFDKNVFIKSNPSNYYPGDPLIKGGKNDWSSFNTYMNSQIALVGNYKFDVGFWSEPDFDFLQNRPDQFLTAYQMSYAMFRNNLPQSKISAPQLAIYNLQTIENFLNFAKTNNILPDILTWNENTNYGSGTAPNYFSTVDQHIKEVKSYMNKININIPIEIGEYYSSDVREQIGGIVHLWSAFENNQIYRAAKACWWNDITSSVHNECADNSLDGLLTDNDSPAPATQQRFTTARWWLFKAYGGMTGNMLLTNGAGDVNAITSYDKNHIRVIVGRNDNKSGIVTIQLDNINSTSPIDTTGYLLPYNGGDDNKVFPNPAIQNQSHVLNGNTLYVNVSIDPYSAFILDVNLNQPK